MLPLVCSTAPGCSSQFPISFRVGARTSSFLWRSSEDRFNVEGRFFLYSQDDVHKHEIPFKLHGTRYLHSLVVEAHDSECATSIDSSIFSSYPNGFHDAVRGLSNKSSDSDPEKWSCFTKEMNVLYPMDVGTDHAEESLGADSIGLLVSSDTANGIRSQSITAEPFIPQNIDLQPPAPPGEDALLNLQEFSNEAATVLSDPSSSLLASNSGLKITTESTPTLPDTLETTGAEVSKVNEGVGHLLDGILNTTTTLKLKVQAGVEDTYDAFALSIKRTVDSLTGSLDNATNSLVSSVEKTKYQADGKLTVFTGNFRDGFHGTGNLMIGILRKAILSFENILGNAAAFVVYSYNSTKTSLPAEVRETIVTAEGKVLQIWSPISTSLQKAYVLIEGLEKNIGLDPSDPVVQFTLVSIGSATLGFSYWILKYGGYSGDLSPELTLELLKSDEDAVLIDVRPENLRERDGVPDLRRKARFRYTSVNLPEIGDSTRNISRSSRELNDALTAAVIRNLKVVKDGTKIIVLDASGDQSKGIARSLRKLGVKKPYLVQGGFQSWAKSGLRIKELQLETTLSVLNEEAEAILEDLRPTPLQIFGYGLGAIAVAYALAEWEKTLQLIGVFGLGQTIYQRVNSYEDSGDLQEDIRLLLAPVRLVAQAASWATGRLEPNKIGLPTSPSSTAVQNRVLQAAAKHESQPSDAEDVQNSPVEATIQTTETLDLSEA